MHAVVAAPQLVDCKCPETQRMWVVSHTKQLVVGRTRAHQSSTRAPLTRTEARSPGLMQKSSCARSKASPSPRAFTNASFRLQIFWKASRWFAAARWRRAQSWPLCTTGIPAHPSLTFTTGSQNLLQLARRQLAAEVGHELTHGRRLCALAPELRGCSDVHAADAQRLRGQDDKVALVGHVEVPVGGNTRASSPSRLVTGHGEVPSVSHWSRKSARQTRRQERLAALRSVQLGVPKRHAQRLLARPALQQQADEGALAVVQVDELGDSAAFLLQRRRVAGAQTGRESQRRAKSVSEGAPESRDYSGAPIRHLHSRRSAATRPH